MTPLHPEIATPALLVDADVLQRNIDSMATLAARTGCALRPHAKTHKSPAIARRQIAAGASGLTVATLSEAEVFVGEGFEDLFVAYPLWVDADKGSRLRRLADDDNVTLTLGIDSPEGCRALAAQLGSRREDIGVLVEVDSGQHRTGVAPSDAGGLAEQAAHTGLEVVGVFTFPGHSYTPGQSAQAARDEAAALRTAADSLRAHGVEPQVVSGGSTPSSHGVQPGTLTELRPGVYVFGDTQQLELGTITDREVALSCLATVVSHANGAVVLDSGSKALGADRAPWATGHGRLLDHPASFVSQLAEHHAVVTWRESAPRPELGSRVRVVPNHVCNAVNLADQLVVIHNGEPVDRWPIAARGANT